MNLLNRLLMKATGGVKSWSLFAFVSPHAEKWRASCSFWDGIPGSCGQFSDSLHNTKDKAIAAVKEAAQSFPDPLRWSQIYIDDLVPDGEGDDIDETP